MEVNHTIPPIYQRAKKQFGVTWDMGVIFTYGDQIYSKNDINEFKMVHEKVHIKQQEKIGKDIWWDKYFADKEFRLSQELEAYKAEAKEIQKVPNRRIRFQMIEQIARDISSKFYGNIISFDEAFEILNG